MQRTPGERHGADANPLQDMMSHLLPGLPEQPGAQANGLQDMVSHLLPGLLKSLGPVVAGAFGGGGTGHRQKRGHNDADHHHHHHDEERGGHDHHQHGQHPASAVSAPPSTSPRPHEQKAATSDSASSTGGKKEDGLAVAISQALRQLLEGEIAHILNKLPDGELDRLMKHPKEEPRFKSEGGNHTPPSSHQHGGGHAKHHHEKHQAVKWSGARADQVLDLGRTKESLKRGGSTSATRKEHKEHLHGHHHHHHAPQQHQHHELVADARRRPGQEDAKQAHSHAMPAMPAWTYDKVIPRR